MKLNDNTNGKCKALGDTIDKLCDKIEKLEEALTYDKKNNDFKVIQTHKEKKIEKDELVSDKVTYASVVSSTKPAQKTVSQPIKTPYLSQPKVLYVGDSVAHSANLRKVEKSRKCRIRSARAYSSTKDDNSMFPAKNFSDVVYDNLKNSGGEEYDVLVMSAPSVDISNLNPSNMNKNIIEDKIYQSSKNMIKTAEEALANNTGSLKKVIIMEHPPRFDGLRSQLVKIANNALTHFRLSSPCKDMIVIGQHSLESSGAGYTHMARYQDYYTGRYDGVHLYGITGAKDYTDSVNTLLMMALSDQETGMKEEHTDCEQAQYQRRQAMKTRQTGYRYGQHVNKVPQFAHSGPISTQNRFDIFSQGN